MSVRARAQSGQASVEWVAGVALVAGVLALAVALAHGRDHHVGRHITRQWARALCIVRAGDCWRDKEPCAVSSKEGRNGLALQLSVFHLASGTDVLLEERSDGTVAVTKVRRRSAGLAPSAGWHSKLQVNGMELSVGAELQASLIAHRDKGSTWIASSMAEARALVQDDGGRPADISIEEDALHASLEGTVGGKAVLRLDVAKGELSFDSDAVVRHDRRTGRRTVSMRSSWKGKVTAGGVLGVSGGVEGETFAVEYDAEGRPVDLQVVAVGATAGAEALPGVARPAAGMLQTGAPGPHVVQVVAHLDLTDAENLAAARDVLDAVARRRPSSAEVDAALRQRIEDGGTVEARVLGNAQRHKGASVELTVGGVPVGATLAGDEQQMQLQAAASRGLDGQWLPRTDCVASPV